MGRPDRCSARRGDSAQRRRVSANDLLVDDTTAGRARAVRARGRMRRARHRDEDEEEAQDDGPQREPIGPGADALGRPARRAAAVDLDQPGQRGRAHGAPGDLDRPPARWRRERGGRLGRRRRGARARRARSGRGARRRSARSGACAARRRPPGRSARSAACAARLRLGRGALEATGSRRASGSGAARSKRRERGRRRARGWSPARARPPGPGAWRSATARAAARASRRRPRRASFSRLRSSGSRRYCTSSHHARSGWGITGVAVLFRVLTGLADGLALKELALRVGRRDSPQLWVPRFPTLSRATTRFENGELSGLDGGHSNTRRPR